MSSFRDIKYYCLDNFRAVRKTARFIKRMQKELRRPSLVSIELTNVCNANCIMCSRRYMTRKVHHMALDLAKHIIDECKKEKIKSINLFWMGETILYPHLEEILEYIKSEIPTTHLAIHTNGEFLAQEKAKIILNSSITHLNFSIDGITKETYESIRQNISYEKVEDNIHGFLKMRSAMGREDLKVGAFLIKMDKNTEEAKLFKDKWKSLVDKADTVAYWNWGGTQKDRALGEHKRRSIQTFNFPCQNLWKELVISNDGRAAMCCVDYNITEEIGHINNNSIMEIWRGLAMQRLRKIHMQKRYKELEMCRDCNRFTFQMDSSWERMWA